MSEVSGLKAALAEANKLRALMGRRKSFATSEVGVVFAALDYALAAVPDEPAYHTDSGHTVGVHPRDCSKCAAEYAAYGLAPDIAIPGVVSTDEADQNDVDAQAPSAVVPQDRTGWVSGRIHLPDVRPEVGRDENRMVPAHGYSAGVPSPRGYEPVTLPAYGADGHMHMWAHDARIEYCSQEGCDAWRAKP